ncbi:glycoside hydrolase family 127 protein, partial [Micromonospora azadirachtae]
VLALESVDVPGVETVDALRVDVDRPPRLVDGRVTVRCRRVYPHDHEWSYRADRAESTPVAGEVLDVVPLVEYHAWANRGPSTMRVWLPTVADHTEPG